VRGPGEPPSSSPTVSPSPTTTPLLTSNNIGVGCTATAATNHWRSFWTAFLGVPHRGRAPSVSIRLLARTSTSARAGMDGRQPNCGLVDTSDQEIHVKRLGQDGGVELCQVRLQCWGNQGRITREHEVLVS